MSEMVDMIESGGSILTPMSRSRLYTLLKGRSDMEQVVRLLRNFRL